MSCDSHWENDWPEHGKLQAAKMARQVILSL